MRRRCDHLPARCALFAGSLLAVAVAPVLATVLVDLDAANYSGTGPWANTGSLGETFAAAGTPTRQTVAGALAVVLDGAGDYFVGPASVVPLDGAGPTRSIEVWAYQGNAKPEETMVSWSHRGGPNGTHMSFNYGTSPGPAGFGAVGQWGTGPDLGWAGGAPVTGQWHHLVYTYNPSSRITSVYADGFLQTSENSGPLNTHPGFSINIGAQRSNSPPAFASIDSQLQLSGAVAKVRIHDVVLSLSQIQTAFSNEAAQFNGPVPGTLTRLPVHRYLFDSLGSAGDGTMVPDVLGSQHATIRGAGGSADASVLNLPGGSSATQAYVDLPNGIISSGREVTLEAWLRVNSTQYGGRIFDFGTSSAGEITGPGETFSGTDFVSLSANVATSANQRLERGGGTIPNGGAARDTQGSAVNNVEFHFVLTYDNALKEWRWYRDAVLMEVLPDLDGPAGITDVNNWLGRSNSSADANLDGAYNEVRIYNYALTHNQIYGNYLIGPDTFNADDPPQVTIHPSSAEVCPNSPVTFTAASDSPAATVQWEVSPNNGAPFAPIQSSTDNSLSFTPAPSHSGRRYRAVFRNSGGSATTNVAILTMLNLDADGDFMPDCWETSHGLDTNSSDAGLDKDVDGASNFDEFIAGTDPSDAASRFRATLTASGSLMTVRYTTVPLKKYRVERSANLAAWSVLADNVQGTGNEIALTDADSVFGFRYFYRVKLVTEN
ncbi:MAG: LamG-like jellyroll fold domain-containing protein [Verrucomicrobiales bacterium]